MIHKYIPTFCLLSLLSLAPCNPSANANALIINEGPVSILDSMRAVVDFAPSLLAVQENRKAIYYEMQEARSGFLPQLNVSLSYGHGMISSPTTRYDNNNTKIYPAFYGSVELSQNIWDGKLTSSTVAHNLNRLESIDHRVVDTATALAFDGLMAHVELLRAKAVFEATQRYVIRHQEILEEQRSLTVAGISTEVEISHAEGRLARAIATSVSAENVYHLAILNYTKLTNKTPLVDSMELAYLPPTALVIEDLQAHMLTQNPKILAYMADHRASEQEIGIVRSEYHPSVRVSLGAEYVDSLLGYQSSQAESEVGLSVDLYWNLFSGFSTKYKEKKARAYADMAFANIDEMKHTLLGELLVTFENYRSLGELKQIYREGVDFATKTRDDYMEQFTFGMRSLLDLLDSEAELYTARVQLITVQANEVLSAWKLLALQGNLLNYIERDYTDRKIDLTPWN